MAADNTVAPRGIGASAGAPPASRADALRGILGDAGAAPAARLAALRELVPLLPPRPDSGGDSNNHIHTCYSFSPYTPAAAALRARESGLEVAGSVDHDSISAAAEMRAACAALGLGAVTGFEVRVSFLGDGKGGPGPFAGRKINNPDSAGIVYMTVQGVPAQAAGAADAFLAPIRAARAGRTRLMTASADALLREAGAVGIEFERDVLARSKAAEGGGLTERHLLAAVADRLISRFGRGPGLAAGISRGLGLDLTPKQAALLGDPANPYLGYDMLGILKAGFLDRIFIQPDGSECVDARRAVAFAREIGAIPAYAYLGDVGESPTGDKKAEKFEDDFLDALFPELKAMGYLAVAYMPPRNTVAQLRRVKELCDRHGLMEISGVDINQPRQAFNCPELRTPEFRHLTDSTWALVAHEALSSARPGTGIFSPDGPAAGLPLRERIAAYAGAGRDLLPGDPESARRAAEGIAQGRYSR